MRILFPIQLTIETKPKLTILAKLLTKITGEAVHDYMVANIPKAAWPKAILCAVENNDACYADDISKASVRLIIINELVRQCYQKLLTMQANGTIPFSEINTGSVVYRIQHAGYDSCIFYGNNKLGRYNCPYGNTAVMYCAQYPDTCLAEITEREELQSKGKGPGANPTSRKQEWFDNMALGVAKTVRTLRLIDVPALLTPLKLSGKLTSDDYLWTQAIVVAMLKLEAKNPKVTQDVYPAPFNSGSLAI